MSEKGLKGLEKERHLVHVIFYVRLSEIWLYGSSDSKQKETFISHKINVHWVEGKLAPKLNVYTIFTFLSEMTYDKTVTEIRGRYGEQLKV